MVLQYFFIFKSFSLFTRTNYFWNVKYVRWKVWVGFWKLLFVVIKQVPDAKIPRRMDSVEVSFDFDSRDSGVPVREPLYVAQSPYAIYFWKEFQNCHLNFQQIRSIVNKLFQKFWNPHSKFKNLLAIPIDRLRRPNAPRTRSAGPPSRAGLGGIVILFSIHHWHWRRKIKF